ncbi:MFS transporter [Caldimonas tepidiphila]|uniref:MFS transporter n=1 Tax=Caldimonas tepidiphila TaxID=2315841 RepID=UPI000E5AFF89|nr:MFS transporter [Caldimonas tepidiphila]
MPSAPSPDPTALSIPPSAEPTPPPAPARREGTALEPLSGPVFRMLWLAWLTANMCMWMNDVAAAWLMTTLSGSPGMVALVQTASTLPVFLLGLPSGALADILDRRRYFMATQFWVAGVSLLACAALATGSMTPSLLLVLTFANGIGLAMRWPVFAAIVPEIVPRPQLPAALALNGVAMNASRIFGPLLAGALIASAGSTWVFVLNAVLSVATGFVIMRWRREARPSGLPGERFVGAMRVGLQHVRQSPRMHFVLMRVSLFFFQAAATMSLLPLVAKGLPGGDAGTFTLLLSSLGAGAIAAALGMQQLRRRFGRDQLLLGGSLVQAAATVGLAFAPNVFVAAPVMVISGAAWISVANSLTVTAQMALPDWVRARGMSVYQMALMGSSALGAAVWGQVANVIDVQASLIAAAATGVAALWFARGYGENVAEEEDLRPARLASLPVTAEPVDPDAGPVLITIEYRIDPARAAEFRAVMAETRRARLKQGALSCELFRDTADSSRYIEHLIDESWTEHLRRFDRTTAADAALRERRLQFHIGAEPPVIRRCIAEPEGR